MIAAATPQTTEPRPLSAADLHELCVLVSRGASVQEAARCIGHGLHAIREERDSNEAFRRKLARARLKAKLAPIRAMQRAMLKDWRAAAWYLERTNPEKFGRKSHRAFSQKQTNALINDITSIVGEEVVSQHVGSRLSSRIEAAIRYAWHAHTDTNRTAAELSSAMQHHDTKSPRHSPAHNEASDLQPTAQNKTSHTSPKSSAPPTITPALASSASSNLPSNRPTTPTPPNPASSVAQPNANTNVKHSNSTSTNQPKPPGATSS